MPLRGPNLTPKELRYKSLVNVRAMFFSIKKKKINQISYYRHSAFFGQFRFGISGIGNLANISFTWDGYRTSLHKDQLTGIKQLERNPAVLGQFVMWAEYLQKTRLFTAYISLGLSSV